MTKTIRLGLLLFICATVVACSSPPQADPNAMQLPPVPVSTAVATEESVPNELRAVGNVEASSSVEVKSQVAGQLLEVRFAEGANVRKGDLLFEIDPRPYRDAVRQAEATLVRDEAQLRAAEANLARDRVQLQQAESDAQRYEQLLKDGIAARNQQEQLRANANGAVQAVRADEAMLEGMRALLDSDRAAIDRAKLDLNYCQILSPVSGRAGNLLLHAGNLVKANDTSLVVVNQVAPIFVNFGVPERYLNDIKSRNRGRLLVVATVEKSAATAAHGVLSVIDNTVDANTGTIRLKASFDNKDSVLWPGQFVNVVLTLDTQKATVMPEEAVQAGQQGPFVYVVKADQTVEPRPVTTGATVAGKIIVEKGVAAGETVVIDGQSRLYPGAKIKAAPPTPAPAPKAD